MYEDKLDGTITRQYFDRKSEEWQDEVAQILKSIEVHQNASNSCLEEGIRMLELLNRAWELYEQQEMAEKRRLLDFVCSNSSWRDGKLTPKYRKPFDLIVEASQMHNERATITGEKFGEEAQNEIWLPD